MNNNSEIDENVIKIHKDARQSSTEPFYIQSSTESSNNIEKIEKSSAKMNEETPQRPQGSTEPSDMQIEIEKSSKNLNEETFQCSTIKSSNEIEMNEESSQSSTEPNNYDPNNVHYEGEIAIYTDKNSGYQFQWDKETNQWITKPKDDMNYSFEDDTHVYTDKDGIKFSWDKERRAWFPKLDDDFMAAYQMQYGFNNSTENSAASEADKNKSEVLPTKVGEKRKASEPTWFEVDDKTNTNVYVSNLPLNIEEQEFVDLMQKCGLVMRDPLNGNFKIKLYKEPETDYLKGDALCTYIKIESVELALNLLDGYVYKDHKIKVEKAKFQLKGQFDPKLKPKMKKRKDKLKLKKQQEKLFDWRPEKKEGDRSKHERVCIVKNLFDPELFDKDVSLILEFQEDLREECGKIGQVRKVILYDRHPEGIAQIIMASPAEAEQCVKMLNGRWFMKRQLYAEIYDGKTKFKITETDSQITQRLEGWDKFLENDEDDEQEVEKK